MDEYVLTLTGDELALVQATIAGAYYFGRVTDAYEGYAKKIFEKAAAATGEDLSLDSAVAHMERIRRERLKKKKVEIRDPVYIRPNGEYFSHPVGTLCVHPVQVGYVLASRWNGRCWHVLGKLEQEAYDTMEELIEMLEKEALNHVPEKEVQSEPEDGKTPD